MKKWIFSTALILIGFANLNAQEGTRFGGHLGFTTADASDYLGVNIGAEVAHLFPIIDNLYLGAMIGLDVFIGKDIPGSHTKSKGLTMVPIAARGQYLLGDQFYVSADLGFGMGMSKVYKGGFLFEPRIGWFSDDFEFYGFYKNYGSGMKKKYWNISDSFSSISVLGVGGGYFF